MLASILLAAACGDDGGSSTPDPADPTASTPEPDGDRGNDAEPALTIDAPDCERLGAAADTLVGPGSSVDQGTHHCQFYGDGGDDGWRVFVSRALESYPELDFARASRSFFNDPTGMVEEEAPEGWTVAASRTIEDDDREFPRARSQRFLYLGGPGIAGLLRCELERDSYGGPGQPSPAPPTIDLDAFVTFCDTAREQLVVPAR